jgi:hypothetical protein
MVLITGKLRYILKESFGSQLPPQVCATPRRKDLSNKLMVIYQERVAHAFAALASTLFTSSNSTLSRLRLDGPA